MARGRGNGGAALGEAPAAVERRIRLAREAQNRAALRRAQDLNKPDPGIVAGSDVGPSLAIARKSVEVHDRALIPDDPQQNNGPQRNGVRAQRVWAPERLSRGRNPAVEQHMLLAATRFYDDFLTGELGARPGRDMSGIHVPSWNRTLYSERQADARQSFRNAMKAAGPRFGSILRWCVLQETPSPNIAPTVDTWARSNGWRVERAVGFLAGGLELLAVHYNLAPASTRD